MHVLIYEDGSKCLASLSSTYFTFSTLVPQHVGRREEARSRTPGAALCHIRVLVGRPRCQRALHLDNHEHAIERRRRARMAAGRARCLLGAEPGGCGHHNPETVPAMIIVDVVRKGAVTSMIAVEFGWLGFLDIMWLASAAYTTSIWPPLGALCSLNPNISNLDGACVDVQTSMAFGWLNWIVLTAYLVLLFVFCIVSANRGRLVWTSTVKTANWASGKGYSAPPMQHQVQPSAGYGAPRIQYQMQAPTGYTAKQYDPTD